MDINKRLVTPGKVLFSTGTPMRILSVIPVDDKRKTEVFWVEQLLCRLAYFSDKKYSVYSYDDDSDGNHDVVIELDEDRKCGVQVTELTRELQRSLTARRDHYLKKIIAEFESDGISSPERVVVSITFSQLDLINPKLPKPKAIARLIKIKLEAADVLREKLGVLESTDFGQIMILSVGDADFCVPHANNIGVDVSFDELTRTFSMYKTAIDCIINKKRKSQSPVLVIWSTSLWRDKHWVMGGLVEYMINVFKDTHFSNVYLIESMDGDGWFQENLSINIIKTGGNS